MYGARERAVGQREGQRTERGPEDRESAMLYDPLKPSSCSREPRHRDENIRPLIVTDINKCSH